MTALNGMLPASSLVTVAPGEQLSTPTANAYRALVAAGKHVGITVALAGGVGSGYRSLAVQELYVKASHGDADAARQVGLNPGSSISVAAAGYSSHGWGTRADLLFNGSSWPTKAQLDLAAKFGFTREFGADDPNHFEHDGKTAILAPATATAYVVKSGDTLGAIASAHGTTWQALARLNNLTDPDKIAVGQRLRLR